MKKKLHVDELLDILEQSVDTVWLVGLKDFSVEIQKDAMAPELTGAVLDYEKLYHIYLEDYVYHPDGEEWHANMSVPALEEMCRSGCTKKVADMRFRDNRLGFKWHQGYLHVLHDVDGNPDRILITTRTVNDYRRGNIITKAVETEYDYVVYIEADKNSYVMYTANLESGTPVPPIASDNYELEVAQFHKKFVVEEQQDEMTEKLSIAYVRPILERDGEYTVYCNVIENGIARDKKMRFSYFDREKNIWLLTRTDITAIKEERRQKQLLQDALDAATEANRAKSDFLSRMSHDIRTPMNAIIGMTAIAGAHIDSRERVADCLGKITSSSKLLLSLINEVLDMSKVESGNIVLSEEEIDMASLVQSVVNMIQPMVNQKKQNFDAHISGVENELVIGDSQRLQQILLNLLSNAIKYTQEGGYILLEIKEKPSMQRGVGLYEFSVEDNGIGMTPEFQKKVFEPFERADDKAIRAIPGTGLGMAISKNIVEMMGGTIEVKSEYGSGSKFTAAFRLRLQEQPEWDAEPLAGLPVLIVDDDEAVCLDVCRRLNGIGMDGEYTLYGKEAVEKAVTHHLAGNDYFAVIIDLQMPKMDGIETTRQIRAEVGNGVPIIMISSYDWSEYEDEAIAAGVNGFIVKPLFQSRLIYKLKQYAMKETVPLQRGYSLMPQGDYSGKRVLLVEDNQLNREIAAELFRSVELEVEMAENGLLALEMVRDRPEDYYDLVFMDMQMPVMDGCESARLIRSLGRNDVKQLPIVAMTANAFAEDIEKTRQAGMNEHLPKPIDMELLSQTLARWLS